MLYLVYLASGSFALCAAACGATCCLSLPHCAATCCSSIPGQQPPGFATLPPRKAVVHGLAVLLQARICGTHTTSFGRAIVWRRPHFAK